MRHETVQVTPTVRLNSIRSIEEVAPGEIGFDPLMAFGQRLDPLQHADVDDLGLSFGFADGVQAIAVLGPLEADAFDIIASEPRVKWADHFLADRAQQSGVLIALIHAVAGRLVNQGADAIASEPSASRVQGWGSSQMPVPVHGCPHLLWFQASILGCVVGCVRSQQGCDRCGRARYE